MTLLPFYAISAAISVVLCTKLAFTGAAFVGMLPVFFALSFVGLWVLLLLSLAVLSIFVDPEKPQRRREKFYSWLASYMLGLLTDISRIRVHVSGMEKIPDGRWLLVCNHRSNYDPIVMGWILRKYDIAFISKPQNLRLPVVGRLMHKACYLAIDRENDREALKTILESARLMKQNVVSFAIYPEGTRNTAEELLPFRNGAFKIAQKAKTPIVVAAIRGTENVHKNLPWKHTDVYFEICSVMNAETVTQMKTSEIGEEVRKCIIFANC